MLSSHPRDPARWPRLLTLLLCLALLAPSFSLTQFNPATLANPDSWRTMAGFVAGFFPMALQADFLRDVARETLTTLASATAGIALAMLLGAPLAFVTSHALQRHVLGGERPARLACWLASVLRGLMVILRGIPEIVWALLLVRAVGLGSLPAVLAIGLAYGGMLAKVYAEILESQTRELASALYLQGASRWQCLLYGLWPQALPELLSYSVYRWECAIRASAVMGFVGAGGVGQLLDTSLKMLNGGEVSTLLLVFLLLVSLSEGISLLSRRALGSAAATRMLPALGLLAVAASVLWLWPGWRDSGFDTSAIARFARDFFPPASDMLNEIAHGIVETLAMSGLGSVLALLLGALLAMPAAGRFGWVAKWLSRLLLNLLRGVPDLLWASIAVLAVGLGPAAGVLALALHTTGVLGRLFAETLENADLEPELALQQAGAGRLLAFAYGQLPTVFSQWLAYTLYRWENNIRSATVLGIVGAGGLGQQLYLALSLFQQHRAASLIIAMLLLSWAVEQLSRYCRQRMG
ncbi:phosphonate ABC transporter, permease protein PhnE [Aquitalea aquatilis]|uniref:phosphonate ABC transporter, permease protein PhnE n=1 Tax=Aquitalea aquatilis TaxID=1537400 RepID=UPI001FE701E7|nr:phosphonate ABC transporter, permease protein PhnE [Aquitalea aquatilis]